MAEFITKCPHCNSNLRVQDEWLGMKVKCPKCQKHLLFHKKNNDSTKNNNIASLRYTCTQCKKEYDKVAKFCSECGGKIERFQTAEEKSIQKESNPPTSASANSLSFNECFWIIAILVGFPLLLYWWIDWPRTIFWCTLPLWGIALLVLFCYDKGKLALVVLAGIIWWGSDAHTQISEEIRSTNTSHASQAPQEKNAPLLQEEQNKTSTVTIKLNLYDKGNNKINPMFRIWVVSEGKKVDKVTDLLKKVGESSRQKNEFAAAFSSASNLRDVYLFFIHNSNFVKEVRNGSITFEMKKNEIWWAYIDIEYYDKSYTAFKGLIANDGDQVIEISNNDISSMY